MDSIAYTNNDSTHQDTLLTNEEQSNTNNVLRPSLPMSIADSDIGENDTFVGSESGIGNETFLANDTFIQDQSFESPEDTSTLAEYYVNQKYTASLESPMTDPGEVVILGNEDFDNHYSITSLASNHSFHKQLKLERVKHEDVNQMMLDVITPPSHKGLSISDIWYLVRKETCKKRHFEELHLRAAMNKLTLHFSSVYEEAFVRFLHKHAIRRIRYIFLLGFLFLMAKYVYEWRDAASVSEEVQIKVNEDIENNTNSKNNSNTEAGIQLGEDDNLILILRFGVILPVVFLSVLCTLYEHFNRFCEWYTSFTFVIVTAMLVAEKIILKTPGPILALFVLYIPVFGLTRIRYSSAILLSLIMFFLYIIPVVISVLTGRIDEALSKVTYHAFNYLAVIVGGAVSHYRQELLRRRNFMLYLPFVGQFDPKQIYSEIKKPAYKKKNLLRQVSLRFRDKKVESGFYQYWYLLDPHPFGQPSAAVLHAGVFKTIRFAVGGVILGQCVLALQDNEFIYEKKHQYKEWIPLAATLLRFALVIPAYLTAVVLLWILGRSYYRKWKRQAKVQDPDKIQEPQTPEVDRLSTPVIQQVYSNTESGNEDPSFAIFQAKHNYVPRIQYSSAVIVFLHGMAMGTILVFIRWGLINKLKDFSIGPIYFLSFLNAILFPHRSGFRLRFIYSSVATALVLLCFGAVSLWLEIELAPEYISYGFLVLSLGMMISYEEETLRRTFFVRRAVREDEFNQWWDGLMRIEGWFTKAVANYRARKHIDIQKKKRKKKYVQPGAQMGVASKYGMLMEAGKLVVAGGLELLYK